jgi:hypothetical protein
MNEWINKNKQIVMDFLMTIFGFVIYKFFNFNLFFFWINVFFPNTYVKIFFGFLLVEILLVH